MYEGVVQDLIDAFGRLPGIGPKTSERLAYFLLRSDPRVAAELVASIEAARAHTRKITRSIMEYTSSSPRWRRPSRRQ